jgi:hypothetical protein
MKLSRKAEAVRGGSAGRGGGAKPAVPPPAEFKNLGSAYRA